jgi:hypothetical protein
MTHTSSAGAARASAWQTLCSALLLVMLGVLPAAAEGSKCGGAGGSKQDFTMCPTGEYVVAVGIRRGAYVDSIMIQCQALPRGGEPGRRGRMISIGPGGGTQSLFAECPHGSAVVGIDTRAGQWLDAVTQVACASRGADGRWTVPAGVRPLSLVPQTAGGTACTSRCRPGEAVAGLRVLHGGWIDNFRSQCRR